MVWAYRGVVPVLPLAWQVLQTAWAVLAPHLALLLLGARWLPWSAGVVGALALAWRLVDPIAGQIRPAVRPQSRLCGIYGAAGNERLDPYRAAVRRLAATYRPTPWLWSGDQRTLAVGAGAGEASERLEEVPVSGCRGDLVLRVRAPPDAGAPVLLMVGGLAGDPQSPFVVDLQRETLARGWGFAFWVTRPDLLLGGLLSAPDPGDPRDIHSCLEHLRSRFARSPLHLTGYSLGASMVLVYCSRYGSAAVCDAAVSVAGTFSADPLHWPHYRRYWQPVLTAGLKVLFADRFKDELPPKDVLARASNYEELIECLPHLRPTSKLSARAFPGADAARISCPLLFFASADDPFHPIDAIGISDKLSNVLYYITEVGGHVGWPEGWSADCTSFHTRVVLGFLAAHGQS